MTREQHATMMWAHVIAAYEGYHGPLGLPGTELVKASTQEPRVTMAGTTLPQSELDHRRTSKLMGMRGVDFGEVTMAGTTLPEE